MSAPTPRRRWPWIAAAVAIASVGLGAFALGAVLRALEREVAHALGPGAKVTAIRAGVRSVVVEGLEIPAVEGWPAPTSLRAERVRIAPTWLSLLSRPIQIARIEIESPYLSMLRTRDGRLRVLPTLVETAPPSDTAPSEPRSGDAAAVSIGEIHMRGGVLELYDATVSRSPWRIRLADVDGRLRDVVAPGLSGRMPLDLEGILDGPQRDGRVSVHGWLVPSTRDLDVKGAASGVDLLALEPYLVKATQVRLESGTLDLDLHATVEARALHAPGHLTLSNLSIAPSGSPTGLVLGVPRDLLLNALRAKGGQIALDFSLDGRIDDPKFSLNETMSTRVGVALAKALGLSVGGLVEGTLGIGLDGLEGAGKAANGVGSALRHLVPRE
jgi:uncharacterized protein DUF748